MSGSKQSFSGNLPLLRDPNAQLKSIPRNCIGILSMIPIAPTKTPAIYDNHPETEIKICWDEELKKANWVYLGLANL